MKKKYLYITAVIFGVAMMRCETARAQWTYGTNGLLNMPTSEMEEKGTFMIGSSYLNKHTSTSRWFYDTFNYYVNVTFFSFLEVSYNMELHKAMYDDYGSKQTGYWAPYTYGKFVNQDRQFDVKLRLWKEGWVNRWTPQIVIGSDDITSHSWADPDKMFSIEDGGMNGFNNRYYAAATKHFHIPEVGELGTHVAWLYNVRSDYSLNAPSMGVNLRLFKGKVNYNPDIADDFRWLLGGKSNDSDETIDNDDVIYEELTGYKRWLSGFNFKMELYPANGQGYVYDNSYKKQYGLDRGLHIGIYDVNIGFEYQLPLSKKRTYSGNSITEIALQTELYGCKHLSVGAQFKVHLR